MAPAAVERPGAWHRKAEPSDAGRSYGPGCRGSAGDSGSRPGGLSQTPHRARTGAGDRLQTGSETGDPRAGRRRLAGAEGSGVYGDADRNPLPPTGCLVTAAEQFGREVFIARRRLGLSQETLAIFAGVHRQEIGLIERGKREPRLATILKLMRALKVEPNDLLAGVRLPKPTKPRFRADQGDG